MVEGKLSCPDKLQASSDFFVSEIREAKRFFNPLDREDMLSGLVVVAGGVEHCTADYSVKRKGFPYFAIEMVLYGSGELTLGGVKHQLVHGSMFSYGPGVAHSITTCGVGGMIKYFVDFTGKRAEGLLVANNLTPGSLIHIHECGLVASVWDEIIWTGQHCRAKRRRAGELSVERLLLLASSTASVAMASDKMSYETYCRCRKYLDSLPLIKHQSMAAIAGECNIDHAYLCRLFRRYAGKSPGCLLRERRMAEAANMLLVPGVSVKEVAEATGFPDQFSFSRAFKKVHLVSPSAYLVKAAQCGTKTC